MKSLSYPTFGLVEDLMLGILRPVFEPKGVNVVTTFTEDMGLPLIMARQDKKSGNSVIYSGDPRFLRPVLLSIDAICEGVNADQDAGYLQEAVTHTILQAWREQTIVPGVGYISAVENVGNAARSSDWATSTGVVQYAALPQGAVRYDNTMRLFIRPDANQTLARHDNPFMRDNTLKE